MEWRNPFEAKISSSSNEIPRILWNPKGSITICTTARHLLLP
jgi:hypothetical protein